MTKFDRRYSAAWEHVSRLTRDMSDRTCCWCLSKPTEEAHHVCYRDESGPIQGREVPGVHVFGVCRSCHEEIHSNKYWIKAIDQPELNNRNTQEAVDRLIFGFEQLQSIKR